MPKKRNTRKPKQEKTKDRSAKRIRSIKHSLDIIEKMERELIEKENQK